MFAHFISGYVTLFHGRPGLLMLGQVRTGCARFGHVRYCKARLGQDKLG